mgnify:CR=1 FL=1
MRSAAKKYNTTYKKKIDTHRDSYLPRLAPKGILQCAGCAAFYLRRRWTLAAPASGWATPPLGAARVYCPACRKIKEHAVSDEIQLFGMTKSEGGEVLRVLRNEEARAREKNPLERIMRLSAVDGGWRVETTTEKLAQRLGRAVGKARGGKLVYKWSHNNKFVRVIWRKE